VSPDLPLNSFEVELSLEVVLFSRDDAPLKGKRESAMKTAAGAEVLCRSQVLDDLLEAIDGPER
jgi:hypothetical protein